MFHFIKSFEKEALAAAVLALVITGLTTEGFGGGGRNAMTAMAETTVLLADGEAGEETVQKTVGETGEEASGERLSKTSGDTGEETGRETGRETDKETDVETGKGAGEETDKEAGSAGAWQVQGRDANDTAYGRQVVGYFLSRDAKRQEQQELAENLSDSEGVSARQEDGIPLDPQDYQVLLKIVEAEAGICDDKGKILVANVILNRVNSGQFPDTVTDVVYQPSQFTPVSNGRINTCQVSSETVDSVNRALSGEDYSQGALFFMNRASARSGSVRWFDGQLTYLFGHQGHEFFK